jgi:hypothetical protein
MLIRFLEQEGISGFGCLAIIKEHGVIANVH